MKFISSPHGVASRSARVSFHGILGRMARQARGLTVKYFFDNIDHLLLMREVWHQTDCWRVLLYVERSLKLS